MESNRRKFIKTAAAGTAGLMLGGAQLSAKSYRRIIGANERLQVAIMGLGRRVGGIYAPIGVKENNVDLIYLCDVMASQRERAAKKVSDMMGAKPKLENDYRKILADQEIDAIFNLTPDHWHTPMTMEAVAQGKHVYVEKPCSHNMEENEWIVAAQKKYNKVVQMGNQQRSSDHTIEIMDAIHNGAIGAPYKAVAFYSNRRGEVPVQKKAAVPTGLDWELFQGPAIRRGYTIETWDYNWHWYGWNYGTAELGNNATHELDIARWALQVEFPTRVDVDAGKTAFVNDGWEMYDTMMATFKFGADKTIQWDGKSRNGYNTYSSGRGTIIYGSEGTVYVDRGKYIHYDRGGKIVKEQKSGGTEGGIALGGGGDMTTVHVTNFFETIRGKESLRAPIDDATVSMAMVHYGNVAYRIGNGFDINPNSGKMKDKKAMKLWGRDYAKGWEPKL
ncbi:MAG: Gfo/Idh/MocA family oxidoreductase [Bacteroidota bacterium]